MVLRPEYLVAIMLQTGRPKDNERVLRFLQETDLDDPLLDTILKKHSLIQLFEKYRRQ